MLETSIVTQNQITPEIKYNLLNLLFLLCHVVFEAFGCFTAVML